MAGQSSAGVRVVVVSDGKRGHENQSRVVARMLGDREPLLMFLRDSVKEGGLVEVLLRLRFALRGRGGVSQTQAAGLVRDLLRPEHPEEFREFAREVSSGAALRGRDPKGAPSGAALRGRDVDGDHRGSPHQRAGTASMEKEAGRDARPTGTEQGRPTGRPRLFVVSTGTPPATMNLLLARLLGARSVVCMTPSLLPRGRFDLSIVPEHDLHRGQPPAPNLLSAPLALGYHDQPAAQFLAQQLCRDHGLDPQAGYIGLAVGGPSKSAPWDSELVHAALGALHTACAAADLRLLATTSRRTPTVTLDYLRGWQGLGTLAYLLDASANPLNPLPAFYELARAMVVTADSFSMASEALHAGHGPLLLPVNVAPPRGGLRRGLELLGASGLARTAEDALQIAQFVERPPERGPANAIYEALAEQVRGRLFL